MQPQRPVLTGGARPRTRRGPPRETEALFSSREAGGSGAGDAGAVADGVGGARGVLLPHQFLDLAQQGVVARAALAEEAVGVARGALGRPVQVEENFSLVQVGYNGAGGFLGLSIKLKPSLYSFAAIQPGDLEIP